MKKILFPHPLAKEFFYSKSRDNVNVPFVNLREAFEEKGYEFHIEVTGELDSYEFIFFNNVFNDSFFGRLIGRLMGRKDYEIFKKAIKLGLGKFPSLTSTYAEDILYSITEILMIKWKYYGGEGVVF